MKLLKIKTFHFLLFFCLILCACQKQQPSDFLNEEELHWLKNKGNSIRVGQEHGYPPLEFQNSEGEIVGISTDYLDILENRLNIEFIRFHRNTLEEIFNAAKMDEVDMIPSITKSPQREEFLSFTDPYFETPVVIIVNGKTKGTLTLEDLSGQKVTVTQRYAIHDYLENHYPDLKLDLVANDLEGLKKLAFDETDVLIADVASVSYYMEKSGISNLHVAGNTPLEYQIAIGIRKNQPILQSIINKTLATISKAERNKIRKEWVFLSTREFWERKNFWYWLGSFLIVTLIGLFLIITWNKSLKLKVLERTVELDKELKTRLKAERSLQESEERYRIVAGQKGQIVYDYNLIDRSILWFGDLENTTGYTTDEYNKFSVEDWENFIHPDDFETANKSLNDAISYGIHYEVIYRYQHKKGHYIPMLDKGTFLKDRDGIPYRMLGIMSNISMQMKKEEQLRIAKQNAEKADRLKTQFLANMSHEIRTPMNGIMGFSSLLTQPDLPKEKQLTYCKIIQQSSQYLQKIIDDILDTSMIESGQLKTYIQPLALNKTFESIKLYFSTNEKLKKETISLHSETGLADGQDQIDTDEIRLKQILINLVGNALKYTHEGRILIKYHKKNEDQLLFEVSDTGIGIPTDQIEHIFERFGQVESTDAKRYGGTGLGLSISKGLIELLGGEIWCESEMGKGTSFYFTLPYSKPTPS
ncbi:MAG: ATP-binding protein [Marinifilaceae bacterium]